MSIFGSFASGTTTTMLADTAVETQFAVGYACRVPKLTAKLDGLGTGGAGPGAQSVIGYIRKSDGTLVASGTAVSVADDAPAAWVDLPFATPGGVPLTAGRYRLGIIAAAPSSNVRVHGLAVAPNLAPNPKFKPGTQFWADSGSGVTVNSLATTTVWNVTGSPAGWYKVTNSSGSSKSPELRCGLGGFSIPAVASAAYAGGAVVNIVSLGGAASVQFGADFFSTTGGTLGSLTSSAITATGPQPITFTGTSPASSAYCRLKLLVNTLPNAGVFECYIDAVQFHQSAALPNYSDGSFDGSIWQAAEGVSPSAATILVPDTYSDGVRAWSVGPPREEVRADNPYFYYRCNEPSGTSAFDHSGNLRTGTYAAGTTLAQTGPISGVTAADFDGTTGRIASGTSPFSSGSNATFEAWVNRDTNGTTDAIFGGSDASSSTVMLLRLASGADTLQFYPKNAAVASWANCGIGTGSWHHVAVVFDNARDLATAYVDGVSLGAVACAEDFTGTQTINVASYTTAGTPGNYFDGKIAEAAVYTYCLSPARILAHYQGAAAGFSPLALRAAVFATAVPEFSAPSGETDIYYARLPFYEAQAVFAAVPDPQTKKLGELGWHGTLFDPERGSFAIVKQGSGFEDFIGERVKITYFLRPDQPRSVYAYVHLANSGIVEDISVPRPLFMRLGYPWQDSLDVTVEAIP